MELFHRLESKNYIDMSYWFSKKGQAFSVPNSAGVKVRNRMYDTFKYHKDGKTVLVLESIKNYYLDFGYYEVLFFYMAPNESYIVGTAIQSLVEEYFQPEWKKRFCCKASLAKDNFLKLTIDQAGMPSNPLISRHTEKPKRDPSFRLFLYSPRMVSIPLIVVAAVRKLR